MFENFANFVSPPSSYVTWEARLIGLSSLGSSYGFRCREALSLNALFYLDCIRARVIKLTLPGRPHAMSGVMWPLLTVEAHVGGWGGGGGAGVGGGGSGRRLEYGTERKNDVINWDVCLCVCVCVWNRLCKYSTMKHRPPIYCPISACVLTQMRPYTLLLSNNFNEQKKKKKKKVGWSLTRSKIGWMNMGDALKTWHQPAVYLQEGGGWGLGGGILSCGNRVAAQIMM